MVRSLRAMLLAVALPVTACGTASDDAFGLLADSRTNSSYERGSATISDFLKGSVDVPFLVIEGTIIAVDPGIGATWTIDDDTERRTILSFGDGEAMANSVHVSLQIGQVISPSSAAIASPVRFGLTIYDPEELETLRDGLVGLEVVAFLHRSAVFDYQEDLWGVLVDGALLCRRGESQPLECPALDPQIAEVLELGAVTDADLPAE